MCHSPGETMQDWCSSQHDCRTVISFIFSLSLSLHAVWSLFLPLCLSPVSISLCSSLLLILSLSPAVSTSCVIHGQGKKLLHLISYFLDPNRYFTYRLYPAWWVSIVVYPADLHCWIPYCIRTLSWSTTERERHWTSELIGRALIKKRTNEQNLMNRSITAQVIQ